ncbi:hypothetical protein ACFE04_019085 [Oxalis oulophora]
MNPVVTSALTNVSFIPGSPFAIPNNPSFTTKCTFSRKSFKKHALSSKKHVLLPLTTSVRLFPSSQIIRKSQLHILSATETDVALEQPEVPPTEVDTKETSGPSTDAKRARPSRKSDMPAVSNEALVAGAKFTGKIRSIQPFGAFVDFGAFTDGLVHVSQLSDDFVKDVGQFVSVGQEVTVRLVEANISTGRISLSMREGDDSPVSSSDSKPRPARRTGSKPGQRRDDGKSTKLVKGQDLKGTVKNLTRSGAFISLPEGEEGFLPHSEEADDGLGSMMGGGSSMEVGQEVDVRVLRIQRGSVTLTMKKEEDSGKLDSELTHGGVVHVASNPFLLAFRKNKDISAFLDEKEKEAEKTSVASVSETIVEEKATESLKIDGNISVENEIKIEEAPSSPQIIEEEAEKTSVASVSETIVEEKATESLKIDGNISVENEIKIEEAPSLPQIIEEEPQTLEQKTENEIIEEPQSVEGAAETLVSEENEITGQESSSESLEAEEVEVGLTIPDEGSVTSLSVESDVPSLQESKESSEALVPEESVSAENEISVPKGEVSETEAGDTTGESETPPAAVVEEAEVVPTPDDVSSITSSSVEPDISFLEKSKGTVRSVNAPSSSATARSTISPSLVKQLREETGAGMMECKNALSATEGDIVKALEYLRKKGLASADKKASRATAEGRIGSYIHDSRIGVLLEVNCETDFVSRGEIFKELVDDLAMQVAAYPQVEYLVTEDVPEEFVKKETELEMQKEDLLSKPEQIRSKIVEGRIKKRLEEMALLEQPYIKNDKMVVKDWVKQTIATVGENIKVKRFIQYNLGEGLEKKSQDFAAEVAAQTAAKPVTAPEKEQPPVVETTETVEKPQAAPVSAGLVKQLREETGAGMMDCKKALAETGGDLEKAQEYLRKKGLSSADKKSSRLAAEGRIGSYIHDSRIGVLIEVNCETDFVGRSERFKELVDDLAMQVVACPLVQYVSIEDIPVEIRNKEKELEMQREDLKSKPENIREKIVEGRVSKRLGELALLEQPYIKDDSVLIKDFVKQSIAGIGENIKVRRFVRFTLGETTEDHESDS